MVLVRHRQPPSPQRQGGRLGEVGGGTVDLAGELALGPAGQVQQDEFADEVNLGPGFYPDQLAQDRVGFVVGDAACMAMATAILARPRSR